MTIKQKIRNMVAAGLFAFGLALTAIPATPVQAACSSDAEKCCGGVETSIIGCNKSGDKDNIKESGLWGLLLIAVNILSAGVGVLALVGIIYGAVLYTSAGGSPDQVKKAKNIFINVAIGIIAFAGMYALLNFIVPGGVFN